MFYWLLLLVEAFQIIKVTPRKSVLFKEPAGLKNIKENTGSPLYSISPPIINIFFHTIN